MEIRLLGDIQIVSGEKVVAVSAPKLRALLACLALGSGRSCSTTEIVEALWPHDPPASAANLIQGYVSALRKLLGAGQIRTVTNGYILELGDDPAGFVDVIDALKFRSLVEQAREQLRDDSVGARRALRAALDLWSGPALGDTQSDGALGAAAQGLNDLRLEATELRIRADLASGDDEGLVSELIELVDAHPYNEGLVGLLALALYRNGRQADALRRIDAARGLLLEDLGITPGSHLLELEHQILAHDDSLEVDDEVDAEVLPEPTAQQQTGQLASQKLRGRAREMVRLEDRLASAGRGERCTIFVGGEPGIGKSTLAREVGERATEASYQVLLGRCDEHVAAPYRPFVEVVLSALRRIGPDRAAQLLGSRLGAVIETVPAVVSVLDEGVGDPSTSTDLSLLDRFETLCWVLQQVTSDLPTLIVLEDIHWADSATIRFLHFLAVGRRLSGVLVVATHRTTEEAELLADVLADLRSEPEVERMALRGLDSEALRELVRDRFGAVGDDDLVAWVLQQTDGNPFLALELVDHVMATGSRFGLPLGVTEVVSRRLRRLSPSAYRLLEYAAVLGDSAPLALLRAVATDIGPLQAALAEVTTAGILIDDAQDATPDVLPEEPVFRFQHAIIRSAVVHKINSFERQDLHLLSANAWSRTPNTTESALEVASHLWSAGSVADSDEAFAAFTQVAQHADRNGARVEAVLWYDRALGLVSNDDPRHRTTRLTRFVAAQAAWHWLHGDA